jgi:hypothetical protein
MSGATSVDPMVVLFGLEEKFSVLDVQRIDPTTVKMIIEQLRGGRVSGAWDADCGAQGAAAASVEDLLPAGRRSSCGGASAAA